MLIVATHGHDRLTPCKISMAKFLLTGNFDRIDVKTVILISSSRALLTIFSLRTHRHQSSAFHVRHHDNDPIGLSNKYFAYTTDFILPCGAFGHVESARSSELCSPNVKPEILERSDLIKCPSSDSVCFFLYDVRNQASLTVSTISSMPSPTSTVTRVANGSWMLSIFTLGTFVGEDFTDDAEAVGARSTTFLVRLLINGQDGAKSNVLLTLGLA